MTFLQKRLFLLFIAAALLCVNTLFSQQDFSLGQAPAVSVEEYTEFLNCVGATDTYGLYNEKMGEDQETGSIITRSGKPGSYTYSYNPETASLPVTYVTWFSAIRYCNWRSHHGATGLQDESTTETGSYDLTAFDKGGDISSIVLAPGASFFLPTKYLVDTMMKVSTLSTLNSGYTDASDQSCDPYLASSRLGFCFTTWNASSSSADDRGGNSVSLNQGDLAVKGSDSLSGNFSRSSFLFGSMPSDRIFNTPSRRGISMLGNPSPNSTSNQLNMSLVVVSAPNNPADVAASGTNKATKNEVGYGSVLMPYQIGTYDVTAEQYCAFLNAVANKSDLHGLYNTNMSSDPDVACITRSGDAISGYTYTSISGREKFPITYVTWYTALRFCNWLENGQPTGGQPDDATENGAYNIAAIASWTPKPETDYSLLPNPGTAWALPTENQWYKAAYYVSSTNSTNGVYCAFGTGSMNNAPGNKWEETVVGNRANYSLNGCFTASNQPRITPVGSFSNSRSPWGAYDMAGEVNQWTSTFDPSGNYVIIRGGSWNSQKSDDLKSTTRFSNSVTGSSTVGFRVVYNIPPAPVVTHLDMTNDLVAVRDANNRQDDPVVQGGPVFGSVPTEYQIGKYDITAEQYCMFLNAVAAHADPHQLYRPEMTSDSNVACIIRYGNTNRGYSYFPWPGREKLPITYVNWFAAVRFCNWLENDQPVGDESPGITETGSFNISNEGVFSKSTNNPKWLLPTENQWYKAAYYKPGENESSGFYYSFGTSSYTIPNNSLLNNQTNAANYCLNGVFAMPTAPYLTPVGAFKQTKSPYGAYDMAGNVNQWTLTSPSADGSKFVVRGGSWNSTSAQDIRFSTAQFINANVATNTIGFRLVYNVPPLPVPPPTTWEQISHGAAVCGNDMKDDFNQLVTGEVFKKPGTFFFSVMYYTIGGGLSEMIAKALNSSTYLLNWIFTKIGNLLKYLFGDAAFEWFDGWIKAIYDFLLSPIQSRKLDSLRAARLEEQMNKTLAEVRAVGVKNLIFPQGAAEGSLVDSSQLEVLTAATEALESANVAFDAAVAAEASQAALVAFFASPAAAIIIPALLAFGSYEAFIATTNNPNDGSNDPRISVGLALDTLARYLWPAIQLCL